MVPCGTPTDGFTLSVLCVVTVKPLNSQTEAARCIRPHYPDVSSLQVVEGQLDVLEVEVEQLGDQVEQAVQNWSLEELSRPYSRLSSLKQELQHQAALRYTESYCCQNTHLSVCVPVCPHCPRVSCQGSEVKGGSPSPRVQTGVVRLGGLDEPAETDSRVSGAGQRLPACSGNISLTSH